MGLWAAVLGRGDAEEARDELTALLPRLVRVLGVADEQTLSARLALVGAHDALKDRAAALAELSEIAAHAETTQEPEISAAVEAWRRELG